MSQQLQNGKRQFFDGNGNPLAGGAVYFYLPGTLTATNTWQDPGLTTLNTNPVILDASGAALIWGADGTFYRQIVKDALGNTIWDQVVGNGPTNGVVANAASMQALRALPKSGTNQAQVAAYYAGGSTGGGAFTLNASDTTSGWFGEASISGNTMTIIATTNGALAIGQQVNYAGSDGSRYITAGSGLSWTISGPPLTVLSTTMTGDNGGSVIVALDGGRWWLSSNQLLTVYQFGAKGNGVTDDTLPIQAAMTASAGKELDFGSGSSYLVSSPLIMSSNTRYFGASKLKAAAAFGNAQKGLFDGSGLSNARVEGLEIDGNGNNAGAYFGIFFSGGSSNEIRGCYVHDTYAAGISVWNESDTLIEGANRVINCGRAGASTDGHGIMLITQGSTVYSNCRVTGNTVEGAYRKGITLEAQGTVGSYGFVISGNNVSGCGLTTSVGGIYISGSAQHTGMAITGNACNSNYLDVQIANVDYSTITGNASAKPTGSYGFYIADSNYNTITGNNASYSQFQGMLLTTNTGTCTGNTVSGNTITHSSRAGAGLYAGLELLNASGNTVGPNAVNDDPVSPMQAYGIYEAGTSDYNSFFGNTVNICWNGQAHIVVSGPNSSSISSNGQIIDVQGQLGLRDIGFSTTGGDLALSTANSTIMIQGPTANFSVTGILQPHYGQEYMLVNTTVFTMTVVHNNATTPAGDRIYTAGGVAMSIPQYGSVTLTYSLSLGAWIAK